jgi:hypothetical protein
MKEGYFNIKSNKILDMYFSTRCIYEKIQYNKVKKQNGRKLNKGKEDSVLLSFCFSSSA